MEDNNKFQATMTLHEGQSKEELVNAMVSEGNETLPKEDEVVDKKLLASDIQEFEKQQCLKFYELMKTAYTQGTPERIFDKWKEAIDK